MATLDLPSDHSNGREWQEIVDKRPQIIIQSDAKHEYCYYYHDINGTTDH